MNFCNFIQLRLRAYDFQIPPHRLAVAVVCHSMKPYLPILICLLFACKTNKQEQANQDHSVDTVTPKPIYRKPEFARKFERPKISVSEIVLLFNKIYPIDPKDKYYSLTSIDIKKLDGRYGLTSFDTSGAVRYIEYGNFKILEYLNSDFAKFAFGKIFDATIKYQSNYLETSDEGIPLDENILSKGGIVYILKDSYIISKYRRCNDNWKQNEKLEDRLIDQLFNSRLPKEKYLIRACCSCPNDRQIQVR